ncbi:hypothetical protein V6N12_012884 [Hibiscus sabdariffa]|uniref:Uncharacterized protein n=1 Tax=Hibiscus sabdariffa TaxID=183260 RepID=A0ABR2EFQ1_9ROSI
MDEKEKKRDEKKRKDVVFGLKKMKSSIDVHGSNLSIQQWRKKLLEISEKKRTCSKEELEQSVERTRTLS